MIKVWVRVVVGIMRKDGRKIFYEDKIDGYGFLNGEKDK